jgi:hypothetical protein
MTRAKTVTLSEATPRHEVVPAPTPITEAGSGRSEAAISSRFEEVTEGDPFRGRDLVARDNSGCTFSIVNIATNVRVNSDLEDLCVSAS